ncbi:MAG: hypothetical protein JXM79_21820 [Sedimentisphaerales bacterium]|nr:hypothetical protein [Sedimentisphaerales bacterium]
MITQTDILESLRATLLEEEKNYVSHLVDSEECIYAVDSDLNTTYVSPSLMELLDVMDSTELINKPFLPESAFGRPPDSEVR